MNWNSFVDYISAWLSASGAMLLQAVIIFVVGYFVIKFANKSLSRFLSKSKVDKTVRRFLLTSTKILLYVALLLIIASFSGFSITGIVALFSAVGIALSLAMQSSLSNFANGVVLLVTKPFKSGDLISVNTIYSGVVSEIGFIHTIIINSENKEVKVPNKLVTESVIVNSSALLQRKLDYEFLVSYKSNVEQVKDIILSAFTQNDFVLNEPAPFVALSALEQNGIRFVAYCYTDTKNYIATYYPLLEKIFNEFKKQGIELPYSQMQVHLNNEKEKLPVTESENKHKKDVNKKDNNRFGKWLGKGKDEVLEKATKQTLPAEDSKHGANKNSDYKTELHKQEETDLEQLEADAYEEENIDLKQYAPDEDEVTIEEVEEIDEIDETDEEEMYEVEEIEELDDEEVKDYLDYVDEVEIIVQEEEEKAEVKAEINASNKNNEKDLGQTSTLTKKQFNNSKQSNKQGHNSKLNSANNGKNNGKNNNKSKFPFFKPKGQKGKKHTVIIKKD